MDTGEILKTLLKQVTSNRAKDYTYLTIFFLVFSFFVFFAIRPSLVTAFSLIKEERDLRKLDQVLEKTISAVVANQTTLETVRDRLELINSAVPDNPYVNGLLTDIEKAAKDNNVILEKMSVTTVNLVRTDSSSLQPVNLTVETTSSYEDLLKFIKALSDQRRLKEIKKLEIASEGGTSTESGTLKVNILLTGFFL